MRFCLQVAAGITSPRHAECCLERDAEAPGGGRLSASPSPEGSLLRPWKTAIAACGCGNAWAACIGHNAPPRPRNDLKRRKTPDGARLERLRLRCSRRKPHRHRQVLTWQAEAFGAGHKLRGAVRKKRCQRRSSGGPQYFSRGWLAAKLEMKPATNVSRRSRCLDMPPTIKKQSAGPK